MRLAIGCDDAAFALRDVLRDHIVATHPDIEVTDLGLHPQSGLDYPDIAIELAEAVARGKYDRGVLLCGTGLGVAITANKVAGIRAATVHDVYSAERARKSNNAQIITLGARVIGPELAKMVVDAYLASEFGGGKSADKIAKIGSYETGAKPTATSSGSRSAVRS
jgi:ribose 5-phosphate isomerase B